jgi:capsular polysaccharide transport system permease protein
MSDSIKEPQPDKEPQPGKAPLRSIAGGAAAPVITPLPMSPSAARRALPHPPADGVVKPATPAPPLLPNPAIAPAAPPAETPDAELLKMHPPIAGPAKIERRHYGLLATFLVLVLLPVLVSGSYLWLIAKDQFESTVAFSIRKEDVRSSLDLLGGITKLSGSGSSDTDVLYEFIQSQELVAVVDKKLDLGKLYSEAWPMDPVFGYDPSGTIEDLQKHWARKVQIVYDASTELMTLHVLAFTADDAQQIAQTILDESTKMINALTADSRADATRYAQEELERAVARLKTARGDLTAFRLRNQIVDPQADLAGQMGVLNTLQAQLATSLVELDLLRASTGPEDTRVQKLERRIEVIQNRIATERLKFGVGGQGPGGEDYATLVAEFERLNVDREFAEQTYRAALVNYDSSKSEAQRKSRYLAAHIQPTHAERATYPRRWTLLGLTGFFLLMAWGIGVLIYYSVRDRQ